ncbi:hypothetical protein Tco_0421372 [Tanacetum coccineum]
MNSIEQCIIERESHEQELKMTLKKLSERQLQIQQCKVQEVQSSVTSSGDETSSGIVSDEEIEKKELEAHYGFMAKIQEVLPAESSSTDTPLDVVNQKHDELVKKSLLTRSQFEGQLKEKSKVISDLKIILANPKYLKIAQSEKPRLYEIPYDTSDPANRFCPNGEETVTLEKESRSKLDKDKVKPYDYNIKTVFMKLSNTIQKPSIDHGKHAKEVRKTIAFPNPTAKSMEVLIKTLLMPLSDKTILDSHCFVHELKTEMHDDLEYVKSLEKEIDELESEKADFSNIYDLLLEECVSKDVIFHIAFYADKCSMDYNAYIFTRSKNVNAQMQDKNIAISELKKLIENCMGKSVETQFDKPSVVQQPNAQRILKPSVLGKPTPFSNSPEMRSFQTKQSVNKTNVSDEYLQGLKPVSVQNKDAKPIRQQRVISRRKVKCTKKQKDSSPIGHRPRSSMFTRRLIAADQASVFMAMMSVHISSGLVLSIKDSDHNPFRNWNSTTTQRKTISSKLVPKVVPLAVKTATSRQELELLFHHHIAMLRTTGINPMIQPELEDLPKDNPKLEIAVLSVKRHKIEDDAKKEELRAYLDIIPRDDEAVNVESLATKYPIVDWKTHALSEDKMYYEIIILLGSWISATWFGSGTTGFTSGIASFGSLS